MQAPCILTYGDQGQNGFPQTQLHTSATSKGFSERAEASSSLTTQPALEGSPSYSHIPQLKPQGTVHAQGTGSRGSTPSLSLGDLPRGSGRRAPRC